MSFDFKKNLLLIGRSVDSLNPSVYQTLIDDCLHSLRSGKKIIVSGLGKNAPICEKFVRSMNSVGLDAAFLHTGEAFHGDIGMVKNGDVVIILSKSGKTPETLTLVDKLKKRTGVQLWGFTFESDTDFCQRVGKSITLSLEREGGPWKIMPMNSSVVSLFILQGLIIDLVGAMGISLNDFKTNHPGGRIGDQLSSV